MEKIVKLSFEMAVGLGNQRKSQKILKLHL